MEPITLLTNKRILLGVTGSIAAYKAVDLASKLTQAGALVDVILTESAERFVTALTFQAVTGRPVYTDLWAADSSGGLPTHIAHVGLGEGADLLAVIPATANTLAKLTHGLADDLLSVTALAARCPLLIAPAMDGGMYQHPATYYNVQLLAARGAYLVEPEEGRFASGLVGKGRLPETPALMGHIRRALGKTGALAGQRLVITAGGTREAIDPVRFITNRSSLHHQSLQRTAGVRTGAGGAGCRGNCDPHHHHQRCHGAHRGRGRAGQQRRVHAEGSVERERPGRCADYGGGSGGLQTRSHGSAEDQEDG